MRTTVAGALLLFGAFIVGKALGSGASGAAWLIVGAALIAGIVCLFVGPILWVRGARRTKAEEMELLRQIAAQGQTPPTS
mgnify:FL=1